MSRSRYFPNPYYEYEEQIAGNMITMQREIEQSKLAAKDNLRTVLQKLGDKVKHESKYTDGGLYVGSSGIAYAFMRLAERTSRKDEANTYLSLAQDYLRQSLQGIQDARHEVRTGIGTGFLLGDWGILAVGAFLATLNQKDEKDVNDLIQRYIASSARCTKIDFLKNGSDEFLVGRAGFLFGALWLNCALKKTVIPLDLMHEIAQTMIVSGQTYARIHNSPCPLMYAYYGTEYLGAAHGLAGILQVLIQVPSFLDSHPDHDNTVRTCVNYMLSLQTTTGNFPCIMDEINRAGRHLGSNDDELVHWCHGAPGVIYLMAAAYLRWKDERYLDSCKRAGDLVWRKGLLLKGPGICHGVAGNGYVFLLLYRLTSDIRHLYRAAKFADFMYTPEFKAEARTPDAMYSLYEGIAGTACYLADFIEPQKAHFPFQDVF